MIKVAVITRTKNRPIMLSRVYESIKGQSFTNFQWVVVNDAGDEGPVNDIVKKAKDEGVNTLLIHRKKSIGMEAASNNGVASSESEYVVIHDDDDTWHKDFLVETIKFLEVNVGYLGVVTQSERIDEKIIGNSIIQVNNRPYNDWLMSIQFSDMLINNPFPPISFLFRRSAWNEIGGFDESLPVLGDWDFHLKVLMDGDIGLLPMKLANYHFRIEVKEGQTTYGNTVTQGVDKHIEFDAKYRNAKLRKDLSENRYGLGHLLLLGRLNMQVFSKVELVTNLAGRYKSIKKKLRF